jgi:dTMP kinase
MQKITPYSRFVTFEGIDFSGKSIQAKLLYEKLLEKKKEVFLFRDPGTTAISESIREILLDTSHTQMSPWTELLLYEAARAQMVEECFQPNSRCIIICDRFFDSTTAYQGYARNLDLVLVRQANEIGSCGVVPAMTFLIDVEPKTALERKKRLKKKSDRMEAEGLDFQTRVRLGYLDIARAEPERVVVVNGHGSIEDIHRQIWQTFNRFVMR